MPKPATDLAKAEEIRLEVAQLVAAMRGVPFVPTPRPPWTGNDELVIEVDADGYHLVYYERGLGSRELTCRTREDFMFELVRKEARALAHSVPARDRFDQRRIVFPGTVARLQKVNRAWAEREEAEQGCALALEPYDDDKWHRVALVNRLIKEGHANEEAERLAALQMPRPPHLRP